MEATFVVDSEKQFKAFKCPMRRERVKGLLRIKTKDIISIVIVQSLENKFESIWKSLDSSFFRIF